MYKYFLIVFLTACSQNTFSETLDSDSNADSDSDSVSDSFDDSDSSSDDIDSESEDSDSLSSSDEDTDSDSYIEDSDSSSDSLDTECACPSDPWPIDLRRCDSSGNLVKVKAHYECVEGECVQISDYEVVVPCENGPCKVMSSTYFVDGLSVNGFLRDCECPVQTSYCDDLVLVSASYVYSIDEFFCKEIVNYTPCGAIGTCGLDVNNNPACIPD